jgi:ribonuclease G
MTALIEAAPGAVRALELAGETVVAAHFARADDPLPLGLIAPARLIDRDGRRGTAAIAGAEALVEPVPADWRQGETRLAQVVREAWSDGVRDKQARVALHDGPAAPAPTLAARLASATLVPSHGPDLLAAAGWDAVVDEALTGQIDFPGGRLLLSPTPAMLVIDVDGLGDPQALSEAAAEAVAAAVRRLGLGGPIVVDFPTLGGRAARAAVDAVLAQALPNPFEKTAINGFGLVQIIRPRTRRSLLDEVRRPGFAALELLRRAMRLVGPVAIEAAPTVIDWLHAHPPLLADVSRLTGGPLQLTARTGAGRGHVQQN